MFHDDAALRHMLRRAGFGASQAELAAFRELRPMDIMDLLVEFDQVPDDVDDKIGRDGYVGVTVRTTFQPSTSITDARQRWLFRMIHSGRPLQERMTLFWHNHFATAYSKVAGAYGTADGTRMMAAKASEDPRGQEGQIETIRRLCTGNFADLVVAMAKDPAMIIWLDGRFNTKAKPQENFGRELMELFSMGVRHYTESDVYAAARVFTGWNLRRTTTGTSDVYPRYEFLFNANNHDTATKTFSFPVYADGSRTIPARAAGDGLQDGLDLIQAVASHPETARRLVRRLWAYFINELVDPPQAFVDDLAGLFLSNNLSVQRILRRLLRSPEFNDPANYHARYSWPVETVVRGIKEVGWAGYTVNDAVTHLVNMGQQLFEPPDVAGWDLGPGWISSGAMLSRMNFAAALSTNQRNALLAAAKPYAQSPDSLLSYLVGRFGLEHLESSTMNELRTYVRTGAWTGTDTQIRNKAAGLVHLMLGSGEWVFV